MPVNDNDPGNVIKLETNQDVLVCENCDCIDFNMVKSRDQIFIFCADCNEQY